MTDSSYSSGRKDQNSDGTMRPGVYEIGARVIHRTDLLSHQRKILDRVLMEIHGIAASEVDRDISEWNNRQTTQGRSRSPLVLREKRHESYTFLIDGQRGSGKTSLMLTIRQYLSFMKLGNYNQIGDFETRENLLEIAKNLKEDLGTPFQVADKQRRLAITLPVISPEEMETSQSVMEAVIAKMAMELDQVIKDKNTDHESLNRKEQAQKLKSRLLTKLAKGWYFSKDLSQEALVRDSLNYSHFVERRSEESVRGHDRTGLWREFVSEYLEFFGGQMLVVSLDDTDTSTDNTVDVLDTIRAFFHHPRIITLVAGNLHSIRQSLIGTRFAQANSGLESLKSKDSYSAEAWRKYERQQVSEYLFKILPSQYRNFISQRSDDFKVVFKESTFLEFCIAQMDQRVAALIKLRANPNLPIEAESRSDLDNYMALWLMRGFYNQTLIPEVARHLQYLKNQIQDSNNYQEHQKQLLAKKRIAVMLFDLPTNYTLQHLMSESDHGLFDWLSRQNVISHWQGRRDIQISDVSVHEHTYSYEYIHFFMDLELSKPLPTVNGARQVPRGLLPKVAGSRVFAPEAWETNGELREITNSDRRETSDLPKSGISMLEAVNLTDTYQLRQTRIGVAGMMENPNIPSNCLYLRDLIALPEIGWLAEEEREPRPNWGTFPAKRSNLLYDIDHDDARMPYFVQVVLLLGSVPVQEPVPSRAYSEALSGPLYAYELNGSLLSEPVNKNSTTSFFRQPRRLVSKLMGESAEPAFHESQADSVQTLAIFNSRELAQQHLQWYETSQSDSQSSHKLIREYDKFIQGIVPRYIRITNDTRRSFSAMRIFQNDMRSLAAEQPLEGNAQKDIGEHLTSLRSDRYRVLGITEIFARLGLKRLLVTGNGEFKLEAHPTLLPYFDVDPIFRLLASDLNLPLETPRGLAPKDPSDRLRKPSLRFETKSSDWLQKNNSGSLNSDLVIQLLAPREKETTDDVVKTELSELRARKLRSLLLLFWGLGPCYVSLIHLDLMGEVFGQIDRSSLSASHPRSRVLGKAQMWIHLLECIRGFADGYGLAAEQVLQNAENWRVTREKDQLEPIEHLHEAFDTGNSTNNIPFILCSDFSNKTLGLREQSPSHQIEQEDSFTGVIGDIVKRTQIAENYIKELYSCVESKLGNPNWENGGSN